MKIFIFLTMTFILSFSNSIVQAEEDSVRGDCNDIEKHDTVDEENNIQNKNEPEAKNKKVLSKNISSIIFLSKQEDAKKDFNNEGVQVCGISEINNYEFKSQFCGFIGKPLSLDIVNQIKDKGNLFFEKQENYFATVLLLDNQEVTSGQLKFLVVLAKLGKVRASGAKYFSNQKIADEISVKSGDVIKINQINKDLQWINRNPFRNVSLFYEPGESFGKTDINLLIEDKRPIRGYAGYENNGYVTAGSSRYILGLNADLMEGQLNLQFMTASKLSNWWGLTGNYIIPFPWRNIFKILGSYVKTQDSSLETDVNTNGKFQYLSGYYYIPLPNIKNYMHELSFGYEFKRTNNFLNFSQDLIFDSYIDISQFLVKYESSWASEFGYSNFGLSFYGSPGNMTRYNRERYFEQQRSGANDSYYYFVLNFDCVTNVRKHVTWNLKTQFQASPRKLLPLEEMSVGGYNTVRGYMENEIIGDYGLLISNELRLNYFPWLFKRNKNNFYLIGFLDIGAVCDADKNIIPKNSKTIASIGPGVRFFIKENLTFRLDYGIQLSKVKDRAFSKGYNSRVHLGLSINT